MHQCHPREVWFGSRKIGGIWLRELLIMVMDLLYQVNVFCDLNFTGQQKIVHLFHIRSPECNLAST